LPLYGGHETVTTRTVVSTITLLCCFVLCRNVNAQAGGDIAAQIKQLQQESRDAQMKNDASWAQQHLADGFVAGNSWGDWQTREDFVWNVFGAGGGNSYGTWRYPHRLPQF
jgi:hypothetical protein